MKKVMIAMSFASLMLVACGGEKAEEKKVEVVEVDPIAEEMNETTQEIEKSTEELDEMLNELEIEE